MKKILTISIIIVLVILSTLIIKDKSREFKNNADIDTDLDIDEEVWFKEEKAAFIKMRDSENVLSIYSKEKDEEREIKGLEGILHNVQWSNDGRYLVVDEGNELVKTTHIIDVNKYSVIDDIKTIGDTVWSPDSKKLLIGAENNKKRVKENELLGTIDLAIYYLWSEEVEPFLEADEYVDYYPKYWQEDNIIGYLAVKEDEKEEKSKKYEVSKEEKVMEIIQDKEGKKEDAKKIISFLEEIDFDKLEKIYGEESGVEVFRWLYNQEIKDEEDITSIIKVSDKLFNEEYEEMTKILVKVYEENPIVFIKALSKAPEYMEELGYAFHFLGVYDEYDNTLTDDLSLFLNAEELTDKEKKVAIDFLNIYALCGT